MSLGEGNVFARVLFDRLDENGDGVVSREEFVQGLLSFTKIIDMSSNEANRLYNLVDPQGSGRLSIDDFIAVNISNYKTIADFILYF